MSAHDGNLVNAAADYSAAPAGSLLLSPSQLHVLSWLLGDAGGLVTRQEALAAIASHDEDQQVSGRSADWHATEHRSL